MLYNKIFMLRSNLLFFCTVQLPNHTRKFHNNTISESKHPIGYCLNWWSFLSLSQDILYTKIFIAMYYKLYHVTRAHWLIIEVCDPSTLFCINDLFLKFCVSRDVTPWHDALQGLFSPTLAQSHYWVTFWTVCTIPTCKWLRNILIITAEASFWVFLLFECQHHHQVISCTKRAKKMGV